MTNKEIWRFFKKYFKSEKRLFIKSFLLIFISSIIGVSFGYLMGVAIDLAAASSFGLSILVLALVLVLEVINEIYFDRLGRLYLDYISNNIMKKISYDVYYKVGLLPAIAFEEKTSGEIINRVINDPGTITDTFLQLVRTVIHVFTAIVVFIYICFNSLIVAFEVALFLTLFYVFSKKFLPEIKKNQKEISKEKDKAIAEVNESIMGIREIRALGVREPLNVSVKNIIRNIFAKTNKQRYTEKNYYAMAGVLKSLLEIGVFITCIILIILEKSSFAFFMAMTYYIYRFMGTIDWIMELSTSFQKMRVAVERIDEILNNKSYKDVEYGNVHKTNIVGNVEFKNVTFKYKNEEKSIFEDFNIVLPANKKIAIVGKSGQGKTSIFNLLLRYFKPDSGVVLIDDIPIDDFDEESFHQNIAIIRQDPFLFNKSILDNLKIVDPYLSLNKIRKACKMAEIDEYIMSLPDKYNTLIGEGGVNLSGGQKQRLAIARALLKESKIILFDEATSALDNENQAKIKGAINNLVKNHTIIIVAHRLSTIIDADIIYLIDEGKVVASGTHKELFKKNKVYKTLYENEN